MFLTRFRYFSFWLWVNNFCLFCVHLMFVYHSVQLSHAWSDFNRLLRVMISETRILCQLILTCNVVIISFTRISGLDIWLTWLVTGTDASCVYCIICSPLSKLHSILPIAPGLLHCWHHLMLFCFVFALICFWLRLIVQFTFEFSLSCTDLCKVSTEDSDHVIS